MCEGSTDNRRQKRSLCLRCRRLQIQPTTPCLRIPPPRSPYAVKLAFCRSSTHFTSRFVIDRSIDSLRIRQLCSTTFALANTLFPDANRLHLARSVFRHAVVVAASILGGSGVVVTAFCCFSRWNSDRWRRKPHAFRFLVLSCTVTLDKFRQGACQVTSQARQREARIVPLTHKNVSSIVDIVQTCAITSATMAATTSSNTALQ